MQRHSWNEAAGSPLDIVTISAINRDRILPDEAVGRYDVFRSIEPGEEVTIDDKQMDQALQDIAGEPYSTHLGGSGFNTARVLAAMDIGLDIGFLGVEGTQGNVERAAHKKLRDLAIDPDGLLPVDDLPLGDCISEPDRDGRKLATCPRANVAMADLLAQDLESAARYCARARVLHVTSFLDHETPAEVARLVRRVRALRPGILVTVDPGFGWAQIAREGSIVEAPAAARDAIRALLHDADFVLLNEREFGELGARVPGNRETAVAAEIFRLCAPGSTDRRSPIRAVVVLKCAGGSALFERWGEDVETTALAHSPVPSADIIDDTGSGDVFAAGFLAGLVRASLEPARFGARLGAMMAREKLQYVADLAHPHMRAVAARAMEALADDDTTHIARLHRAARGMATRIETLTLVAELCRRLPRTLDAPPPNSEVDVLSNERALQEKLWRLLRWMFDDVDWEAPQAKVAALAPRIDLVLKGERLAIETKFLRDAARPAAVADELFADLARYSASCDAMVAVIWDHNGRISEPRAFERDLEHRGSDAFPVRAVVIRPPTRR
jgi:sugar/nucleoside kinase (ribokinase family)